MATFGQVADRAEHEAHRAGGCPLHGMFRAAEGTGGAARISILVFGMLAYAMFFATILYAIGFVSGAVVPKGINDGRVTSVGVAVAVNSALLMLFVVQHTVMARDWFKQRIARIIPEAAERSLFVALASASLMLLFWQWRPMPGVVWSVQEAWAAWPLRGVSLLGWAVVFASSFMINHFDLFGLRQSFLGFLGRPRAHIPFKTTGFYRYVRHPLMVGFLLAFWSTPHMTVGHLFFAAMTTGYIFFGTWIEERDLVKHLGSVYIDYRRRVPGFVPRLLPRRADASAVASAEP